MYREHRSRIDGAVVWSGAATAGTRVLPDGCMDLLWLNDTLVVAGPDTTAYVQPRSGGDRVWGIRLESGIGPAAFGVPADALRDRRVPLEDLWAAPDVRRLVERVGGAPDRTRALETIVGARLRSDRPDRRMQDAAAMLRDGVGVATVADAVGYSERQLHRRSLAAFGYGPKVLARIHRFQRALELVRRGTPAAHAALAVGYADQAHLSRETTRLAGSPLSTLG